MPLEAGRRRADRITCYAVMQCWNVGALEGARRSGGCGSCALLACLQQGLGESVLSVKISASVNTGGCRVVMPEGRSDAPARCGVRCAVSRYVNDWPYRRR